MAMSLASPVFSQLAKEDELRRLREQTDARVAAIAERPDPGLFDFSGVWDSSLPPADTPGGTLFDLRDNPILATGADAAEALFGSERIALTGFDVQHPTANMVLGAGSQLAQAIGTLGLSAAPTAVKASIPGIKALAGTVLPKVLAAGETSAATRAGLGAVMGAEIAARQTGLEDPVGLGTAALQGAGGGILKSISAGAGFDLATGLAEVARVDPELAERIVTGNASEGDYSRLAGLTALNVVPGVAAGVAGLVAPRAAQSEQARQDVVQAGRTAEAEAETLAAVERDQQDIQMGRRIANEAAMEEAVETDAQRRIRERAQAQQGELAPPVMDDPAVARAQETPDLSYTPPAEQVPPRQSARSAVAKAKAAAGLNEPVAPTRTPVEQAQEIRAAEARLAAPGDALPEPIKRPEGYVPPQEQFFSAGAVRPEAEGPSQFKIMEEQIRATLPEAIRGRRIDIVEDDGLTSAGLADFSAPDRVTIRLSPRAVAAMDTAREEAFHAYDAGGLMTPEHRSLLEEFMARPGMMDRLRSEIAKDSAQGDARAAILKQVETDPREAMAKAFALHASGRLRADGIVGRIFDAVKSFWDRAKNLVSGRGFQTGEDVFRSLDQGTLRGDAKPGIIARATNTDLPIRGGVMVDTLDAIGASLKTSAARRNDPSIKGTHKAIGPKVAHLIRQFLPTDGDFAKIMSKKAGRQSQMEAASRSMVTRFDKAIKSLTPDQVRDVFSYVRGQGDGAGLDANTMKAATEFRAAIDEGSKKLVAWIKQADPSESDETLQRIKGAIEANAGSYIARLYEADTNKKFLPKALQDYEATAAEVLGAPVGVGMDMPDAWAKLEAHFNELRARPKDSLTPKERNAVNTQGAMKYMLDREGATGNASELYDAMYQYIARRDQDRFGTDVGALKSSGTTAGTAKNRLRKRTDMPEPFRELLGEMTNSPAALFSTMNSLNALDNQISFMREMAQARRSDGVELFSAKPDPRTGRTHEITGDSFDPVTRALVGGKFVDSETALALNDFRYLKGVGGALDKMSEMLRGFTGFWQRSQTAWSLGSHLANTSGNAILSFLAGNTIANPANAKYYARALKAWRHPDSADFKLAAESGALGRQFLDSGTQSMMDELMRGDAARRGEGENPFAKGYRAVRNVAGSANRAAVASYLLEDSGYRLAAFFKFLEKTGSPKAAAEEVEKFFPNYSRVAPVVQAIQRTPVAAPFLSYRFELPRIFANAVAHSPLRTGLLLLGIGALEKGASIFGETFAGLEGIPEDKQADLEKAMKLRPQYQEGHRLFPRMARMSDGRKVMATTDADRVFPFGSMFQLGSKGSEGPVAFATELAGTTLFAGPIAEALSLLRTGVDLQGIPRIPEDATSGERGQEIARSMMQAVIPPDVPLPNEAAASLLEDMGMEGTAGLVSSLRGGFAAERREKAETGAPDRYGRVEDKRLSNIATATGVRFRPNWFDADYRSRLGAVERGLRDRTAKHRRVIDSTSATPEEKQRAGEALEEDIKKAVAEKAEYDEAYAAGLRISPASVTMQRRENETTARNQFKSALTGAHNATLRARQAVALAR